MRQTSVVILALLALAGVSSAENVLIYPGAGFNTVLSNDLRNVYGHSVTEINAQDTVLTVAQLLPYDVVITWSGGFYRNTVEIGNNLAAYADSGGGVIVGVFARERQHALRGRMDSAYYRGLQEHDLTGPSGSLGWFDVQHPLMEGITSVTANYQCAVAHWPEALLVAKWASGRPAVTLSHNGRVVDFGLYPNGTNGGQWTKLFDNAIRFLAYDPDYDVTVTAITNPRAGCPQGIYTPSATVKNLGYEDQPVPFWVKFRGDGVFPIVDSALCHPLAAGAETTLTFTEWNLDWQGEYTATCSTMSAADSGRSNDKRTKSVSAGYFKALFAGTDDDIPGLRDSLMWEGIDTIVYQDARLYPIRPGDVYEAGYQVVMTYGGGGLWGNPVTYGDSLAKYCDMGGAVLNMSHSACGTGGWAISGRYASQYMPVPYGASYGTYWCGLGNIHAPNHPILSWVDTIFGARGNGFHNVLRSSNCTRISDWTGDLYVQCAVFDSANRHTAYLNYNPEQYTSMDGDWLQQLYNALRWAGGEHDVGVDRVLAPTGLVDSGMSVVPACTTWNYGTHTESYDVRMRIGLSYSETYSVTNHAPGTPVYCTFPSWTATTRGTHAVSCSTMLSGDEYRSNDDDTTSVSVVVKDAGMRAIAAPSGVVDSGVAVAPACTVYNHGTHSVSYGARMKIGSGYEETVTVSSHAPGTARRVTFPVWTPTQVGEFAVVCSTALPGDVRNSNDRVSDSVTVIPPTGVSGGPELPRFFFLDRAQPNPFTRTTVLKYGLPLATDVELAVYSSEGRLVRTLARGQLPPGYMQATWDGRDGLGRAVSHGIYYARLIAGDFTGVTKLVLQR